MVKTSAAHSTSSRTVDFFSVCITKPLNLFASVNCQYALTNTYLNCKTPELRELWFAISIALEKEWRALAEVHTAVVFFCYQYKKRHLTQLPWLALNGWKTEKVIFVNTLYSRLVHIILHFNICFLLQQFMPITRARNLDMIYMWWCPLNGKPNKRYRKLLTLKDTRSAFFQILPSLRIWKKSHSVPDRSIKSVE